MPDEPIGEKVARIEQKLDSLKEIFDDIRKERLKSIDERLVSLERYRYVLVGAVLAGEFALKFVWK
jgi:hypothetical protein